MNEDYIKRFIAMQRLPYEVKVKRAEQRVHEFYHEIVNIREKNVHISVGGLDSLTLLYFIRSLGYSEKDIPAIGATVLEHKSIRRIHKQEEVIPVYPQMPKHRIIQEFGFPVVSKAKAKKISLLQNPDAEKITFIHAIMTGDMGKQGKYQHSDKIKLPNKWIEKFGGNYQSHRPIKAKQGTTFRRFVKQFEELGYRVEFNELVAADYGAPTIRKRFFMIARCDGKPIVWPRPTHAPRNSTEAKEGILKPYAGTYTQIDFSLPCPSIFDTAEEIKKKYGIRAVRPLAPKTMERIARGLKKFVLDNAEPFVVQVNHSGSDWNYCKSMKDPLPVITTRHGFGIVEPVLAPYISVNRENHFGSFMEEPIHTVTSCNQHMLMTPMLIQYHSETSGKEVRGQPLEDPVMTVDGSNRYGLVNSFLSKFYGQGTGQDIKEPLHTVTAGDGHFGEVRAFLIKYYGQGTGQDLREPIDTIPTHDRFGLVEIKGTLYQIIDIGLRMLEPRELYGCQGFPSDYIIDHDCEGKPYPRSEQVARCGNSVCPPLPAAMVRANLPEMCRAERTPNMRIETEQTGQLKFA